MGISEKRGDMNEHQKEALRLARSMSSKPLSNADTIALANVYATMAGIAELKKVGMSCEQASEALKGLRAALQD